MSPFWRCIQPALYLTRRTVAYVGFVPHRAVRVLRAPLWTGRAAGTIAGHLSCRWQPRTAQQIDFAHYSVYFVPGRRRLPGYGDACPSQRWSSSLPGHQKHPSLPQHPRTGQRTPVAVAPEGQCAADAPQRQGRAVADQDTPHREGPSRGSSARGAGRRRRRRGSLPREHDHESTRRLWRSSSRGCSGSGLPITEGRSRCRGCSRRPRCSGRTRSPSRTNHSSGSGRSRSTGGPIA